MSVEKLLADLAEGIAEVKAAKEAKGDEGQMVALYGMPSHPLTSRILVNMGADRHRHGSN